MSMCIPADSKEMMCVSWYTQTIKILHKHPIICELCVKITPYIAMYIYIYTDDQGMFSDDGIKYFDIYFVWRVVLFSYNNNF